MGMLVAPNSTVMSTSIVSRMFIHRPEPACRLNRARPRISPSAQMLTETLTRTHTPSCDTGHRLWRADGAPVEWIVAHQSIPYPSALEAMRARASAIAAGQAAEAVWLLEHPPLYTAGTSARPEDLLEPQRFP